MYHLDVEDDMPTTLLPTGSSDAAIAKPPPSANVPKIVVSESSLPGQQNFNRTLM